MQVANNVLTFLIHTLFTLYIGAFIIRAILAMTRADFYNPISQFLVTITNPLLIPLRKIIPSLGNIDTATWLLVFGLKTLEVFLLFLISGVQVSAATLISVSLLQIVTMIITILLYAVIIRAIFSWFAGMNMGPNPLISILHSITEPILAPARRIIPPVGMFDLSTLVVILVLYSLLIAIGSF